MRYYDIIIHESVYRGESYTGLLNLDAAIGGDARSIIVYWKLYCEFG